MAEQRIVFGAGPVRELLARRPRSIIELRVSKDGPLTERAASAGVRITRVSRADLDRLAGPGATHQGIVAVAGAYEYADLDDIETVWKSRNEAALVVILDGITDPHNLGAIARSAHLCGAHGLIVPRDRSASVGAVATKASAGATEHIAIAQVTNLSRAIDELKEHGLWFAALAAGDGAIEPWKLDATGALGLVLGSEGKGIRKMVARQCDYAVQIPMAGRGVGSFNVSVAAGITLYEVARQRA
jgi:23S rRNA (guanosine2251-2'-O)-methyltransferase